MPEGHPGSAIGGGEGDGPPGTGSSLASAPIQLTYRPGWVNYWNTSAGATGTSTGTSTLYFPVMTGHPSRTAR